MNGFNGRNDRLPMGNLLIAIYGYSKILKIVVRSCGQQVVFSLNENQTV